MASIPSEFAISLKSWPSKSSDAIELPTFFQRVNLERGGLTKLSEASLKEEILKEEAAKSQGVEEQPSDEVEQVEEKGKVATREELLLMLASANQSSMFALEFISLLISKDLPVQASETMSQHLRDRVGMGTLAASKASKSWAVDTQAANNKIIARGRKTQDVKRTVDTILASATRLEKDIEQETRYWSQVLALSEKGWNLCKVPRRSGLLGVRFGSSDSSPSLQSQGLVALERSELGVQIQTNPITGDPRAIRVRIQVNGKETGCSDIPLAAPTLPSSVDPTLLQARNTLFALELWHEINREARNLGSFGIKSKDSTLVFPLAPGKNAILDLVSLGDHMPKSPHADDKIAEGLSISLALMLSYSHRQAQRRRAHVQKAITNPKRITHALSATNKQPNIAESPTILRPILTLLNHQNSVASLSSLFSSLTLVLRKASLSPEPTYTITPLTPPFPPALSTPERIIASLTNQLSCNFSFSPTPSGTLNIIVRTTMTALPTSIFSFGITSAEGITCPPPGQLGSLEHVEEFINFWTASTLATSFTAQNSDREQQEVNGAAAAAAAAGGASEGWQPTPSPNTLRYASPKPQTPSREKLLTFSIHRLPLPSHSSPFLRQEPQTNPRKGLKLRVVYAYPSSFGKHTIAAVGTMTAGANVTAKAKSREGEGIYEWVHWDSDGRAAGFDDGEGEVIRTLADLVDRAAKI